MSGAWLGENAHELMRARKAVASARTNLEQRKAKLLPTEPAPLDQEMRQALRSMKSDERNKVLLGAGADIAFLESALRGPNALSGIDNQMREIIATKVVEQRHPGALAQLNLAEEAVELVEVAARVVHDTARDAGEFPNDSTLSEFVTESVGATGSLDLDIDRQFASLAEIAA